MKRVYLLLPLGLASATVPKSAYAGPQFITDDPEPTELHKWEIFNFDGGTQEDGVTNADMGIDINYGPIKDVLLTAVLPRNVESGATVHVRGAFSLLWSFGQGLNRLQTGFYTALKLDP